MAEATLAESQIESLVSAKGYADCVAFIGDNSVSVVVSKAEGELDATDVARITDIVCGETSFAANCVKVISAE
jgi:stage III sporulation protein AH